MRKLRRVMFLKLARLMRGEKSVVPCIISIGTKVSGNIVEGDVIHIDGKLEGDVSCKELVIGASGTVNGNVEAKSLEFYGELNGKIKVENLFIAGTAKFIGDSVYKTIAIEPGAVLVGNCASNRDEDKAA
ncbi:MAG: polymer-forming cytoskeletal protein [Alphaproteobacteria bacterium]|nr:polymer-forming cytoskeletal protein [Alphaproteobacteria bacterium]